MFISTTQAHPVHQVGCIQGSGPVIGLWQEGEPIQVYHTEPLPLSLWGLLRVYIYATGGACTGHNDKTKLPGEKLLPSGCLGYTTVIFGGHSAVTPGIH